MKVQQSEESYYFPLPGELLQTDFIDLGCWFY